MGGKVLIIDDDPALTRIYEVYFKAKKYAVSVAHTAEDGLAQAKTFSPDCILLDLMMPKISGLQILEQLKGDPQTQSVPVLVLTNLSGDEEAQKALAKGAARFIVKSDHELTSIVEAVQECLDRGESKE